MKLHKEGLATIIITLILLSGIYCVNYLYLRDYQIIYWLLNIGITVMLYLILQFFRVPNRPANLDDQVVLCPADGKVVVIEEVEETEYFKDKRIQISIFMSPLNVHIQWNPISGETTFYKYHKGKHLVAWHPKSSTDNERSTIVVKHKNGQEILFRQIARAVARRVVSYAKEGESVKQGEEIGFIKFGSRVDVFLPLGTKVDVSIDDLVDGKKTILAKL
jgi:phosphatidylserine decarboxylase